MPDCWAGLIDIGGAAKLAGGREPHGIAAAAARGGFTGLMVFRWNQALLLSAQGGADEMRANLAAFESVALTEIPVYGSGEPGEDGVEALLVIYDHSAEGSVGGEMNIHAAVLHEAFAALFFEIEDWACESVENGHISQLPRTGT